jgi:argininosuccinate lyase
VTGRAVALAEQKGCDLAELSLEDSRRSMRPSPTRSFDVLSVDASVASRTSFGGTAPSEVRKQIAWWRGRN